MSIQKFAEKFIKAENEAWMKGNVNALDEVDASDVVYHLQPPVPDVKGLDGHKQYIVAARKAFTDIKFEWKYLTGESNLFAVSYSVRMMFTGEFPGLPPPTGKEVTGSEICLCRLKKGKIVEVWMAGAYSGMS